jgi:hypothetical protein
MEPFFTRDALEKIALTIQSLSAFQRGEPLQF